MKYDDNGQRPVRRSRPVEDASRVSSRDAESRANRPAKKRPVSADEPRSVSSVPRKRPMEGAVPEKRRVLKDSDAASYRYAGGESRPRPASRSKTVDRQTTEPSNPTPRKRTKSTREQDDSMRVVNYLYSDDEYEIRPRRSASSKKRKKGKKAAKPKKSGFLNTLFYAVIAVALALTVSLVLRATTFEVVRVTGDTMYKSLSEGDLVLCTKFDYKSRNSMPERGTVVLVSGQSGMMFRRVVGLPGETVEIAETGDVMINSLALPESYVELQDYNPYPEIKLDPARYYVLCDNRSVTADSREFGPVTKDQLSRARAIIWPLNRIGQIKIGG